MIQGFSFTNHEITIKICLNGENERVLSYFQVENRNQELNYLVW